MENTYHCYANRELSWLRFNERVLEEAEDSRLPLCERLSFLSIFQSNLDEFFMVRIGSLQDQMLLDKNARENKTNMTSGEQIDAALAFIHKLTARRDAAYNGLLEQLAEQGIRLLDFAHMEEESRTELEKLFRQDYLPLLSSFIISKKQAFPFLKNKGIYAVAVLSTKAEKKKIGIVPCGNEIFPRLVPVPGRTGCFILSEELILHFLPLLYKGYKVTSKTLARITRNADIDADLIYDEDLNYRDHMAEVVKKRKKLAPVRLELSREIDEEIIQSLCKNLKLDPKRVFEYDSPLDHSFLFQIEDQLRSHTDLFFAPRHPQPSPALDERKPIIPQILEEDKLIHYPYESIRPFLQLLHEAACDPDVVSIKMTLYRLANHSKVVDALVEAAENGKQVDVLVELKARFDEENNIEWSRLLERAGCHVVYGIEGLKVHSKVWNEHGITIHIGDRTGGKVTAAPCNIHDHELAIRLSVRQNAVEIPQFIGREQQALALNRLVHVQRFPAHFIHDFTLLTKRFCAISYTVVIIEVGFVFFVHCWHNNESVPVGIAVVLL